MGRSGRILARTLCALAFLMLLPACLRPAPPARPDTAPTTLASPTTDNAPCQEPARRTIDPHFGEAAGDAPLWVVGPLGNVTGTPPVPIGWKQKVLWVLAPEQTEALTLSGRNLDDGTPLWFELAGDAPATSVVLDPQQPGIPVQHGAWREWPSYLSVPKAGCYALEARWPGGAWQLTFAAAGSPPVARPLAATPATPPASCPATPPPDPPFVPPSPPAPATPRAGYFWYGTAALWTEIRREGTWWGAVRASGVADKSFWWRQSYDARAEPRPDLVLTARRLDGDTPPVTLAGATHALLPEGDAMLTGLTLPTHGCWEITGRYRDVASLTFVVWVAPDPR